MMNIKKCEECGKELDFFEGYHHLKPGKDFLLYGGCYDLVDESVAKWREFVLSYAEFFNNGSFNNSLQLTLKKIQAIFDQIKKRFGNILIGKEA